MVTAESSTISSYDGEEEELEKFPESVSDSVDKSETKDGGKNMLDKAIDKKETPGVASFSYGFAQFDITSKTKI